jgi:predicted site-specific integrase-resolvase
MRLRQYANKMGVSYKTAFRWWKEGKMASRIYGRRHSKERVEKIKACVEQVMKQWEKADD